MAVVNEDTTLGGAFARALAAKDFAAAAALFAPDVDFRAMTPRLIWEESSPEAIVSKVLTLWFDDDDRIDALEHLETDAFADCERVGYRFRVTNAEGTFLVEQQAYLTERDGRIGWMRVVCSGFRPAG
jgi:hypothetical protein